MVERLKIKIPKAKLTLHLLHDNEVQKWGVNTKNTLRKLIDAYKASQRGNFWSEDKPKGLIWNANKQGKLEKFWRRI